MSDDITQDDTQNPVDTIVTADAATPDVASQVAQAIVQSSPAAADPNAAIVVANVVTAQVAAPAVSDAAAPAVSAAVQAITTAPVDVVNDSDALTAAVTKAVQDAPAITDTSAAIEASHAIANIIATATGDRPDADTLSDLTDAITTDADYSDEIADLLQQALQLLNK